MRFVAWHIFVALFVVAVMGGCRTGPYVTRAQTACSSPLMEFREEFQGAPGKVFQGRYVGEEEANGNRILHFQFPDVLVGKERVLDVHVSLDAENRKPRVSITESRCLRPEIDAAVLRGMGYRSISLANLASEVNASYAIRPHIDNMRYVFKKYEHRAEVFSMRDGEHYVLDVAVDLDWRERSKVRSMLLRVPYLITVPIDTVLFVVLLPFDLALGVLSGGDPPFTILGLDEKW